MATLNEILEKDITRNIDGVIKADDYAHIYNEVDEYVLTKEVSRSLEKVIEGYNDSIAAVANKSGFPFNGVWISGYFGSGKSHLLKILSFLLENRSAENKNLRDIFIPKIATPMFKANFDKALKTPATSILFNIDQQADAARADDENAILYIFEKVFNKMQGYSGETRGIAEFERHLDEEDAYNDFKTFFEQKNGISWETFRSKAFGISRSKLKNTLAEFRGISPDEADKQIDYYKKETELTISGFAAKVKNWLDKKDVPEYRLNFFIDEVGQFIANKTRLMLNLQTITETLSTVCGGRVWIFVTSQEDLNAVVGDPDRVQTNDFSKIHARFKYRISLSSANVEEVIQKRLLEKKQNARAPLGDLFMTERQTFKTLFSFRGGWKEIHFKDKEQFVNSYPFQAYQFPLLQDSLIGLSLHNAFMGRHVSRGERSMLEIFQDVAKNLKDNSLYSWATFDMMFEGIRNTLKTVLLDAVNKAENHLQNPMAVKILKILLLVKYVKEFKSTSENIQTLLIQDLDTDSAKLGNDIHEALEVLLSQTYIQRSGNEYQYLTDEEQDIENEIKNTSVEISDIRSFYQDMIFNGIIRDKKIKYDQCDEIYGFKPAIDDEMPRGTGNTELVIRIITPQHPHFDERSTVLNQAAGRKEMLIFLNPGSRFVTEMRLYHQTRSFTGQQTGHDAEGRNNLIIEDKKKQNGERKKLIEKELEEVAANADIYVMDQLVSVQGGVARDRILRAFQRLVSQSYPNLRMIKTHYSEKALQTILNPGGGKLFDDSDRLLEEDEKEMHSLIQRLNNKGERITVGTLYTSFSGSQYGWYDMAIACICAKLYMRGTISVFEGSNHKDRNEVFGILSRRRDIERYGIKLAAVIKDKQIKDLKDFYRDYFYEDLNISTAKDAGIRLKEKFNAQLEELDSYLRNRQIYPFVKSIQPAVDKIRAYRDKEWEYYFEHTDELADQLLQDRTEVLDKFLKFMGTDGKGEQLSLWRDLKGYYETHRHNFAELKQEGLVELLRLGIESDTPYKNSLLRKSDDARKALESMETGYLSGLKEDARKKIEEHILSVEAIPEFSELSVEQRAQVLDPLQVIIKYDIEKSDQFSQVRDRAGEYAAACVDKARAQILEISKKEDTRYATSAEKKFNFNKHELVDEDDVIKYTEGLKKHYLKLIKENKRIGL